MTFMTREWHKGASFESQISLHRAETMSVCVCHSAFLLPQDVHHKDEYCSKLRKTLLNCSFHSTSPDMTALSDNLCGDNRKCPLASAQYLRLLQKVRSIARHHDWRVGILCCLKWERVHKCYKNCSNLNILCMVVWLKSATDYLGVEMYLLHGLIVQVQSINLSLIIFRGIFVPTLKLHIICYQRLRQHPPAVPHDLTSSFPPLDAPCAIPSIVLSIHLSFPQAAAFDLLLHSACQPALPPLPLH